MERSWLGDAVMVRVRGCGSWWARSCGGRVRRGAGLVPCCPWWDDAGPVRGSEPGGAGRSAECRFDPAAGTHAEHWKRGVSIA